eukprot:gene28650-34592_t
MTSVLAVTSFQQFIKIITELPNASKMQHAAIIRQLLNYVKPFIDHQASKVDLMEEGWFKTEEQLRNFLSRYNTTKTALTGDMKGKIKAVMITALAEIYQDNYSDWIDNNYTSKDASLLIDKFREETCFKKVADNEWIRFSAIYDELRLINFILSQPNKYAMETAATILALGEYLCVSGGKPSQYVICIHHLYTMVTGKKVKGRKISKDRESQFRPKYQSLMGNLRYEKVAETDGEDSSSYDSRVNGRKRKASGRKTRKSRGKRMRAALEDEDEESVQQPLLVVQPTPFDQHVLEHALSEEDDEDNSVEDNELGFDWEEDSSSSAFTSPEQPQAQSTHSLSNWQMSLTGELTKKLQAMVKPELDLSSNTPDSLFAHTC